MKNEVMSAVLKATDNIHATGTNVVTSTTRAELGKQDKTMARRESRCQHVCIISPLIGTGTCPVATGGLHSLRLNVNANASDPAIDPESEAYIDDKREQESDLRPGDEDRTENIDDLEKSGPANINDPDKSGEADTNDPEKSGEVDTDVPERSREANTDVLDQLWEENVDDPDKQGEANIDDADKPGEANIDDADKPGEANIDDLGNLKEAGALEEDEEEIIINADSMPTPSIIVTSATPFERDPEEEENVQDEKEEAATVPEKSFGKRVSFNEGANEEVIMEMSTSRRASLDESVLGEAEKRKLEESIRKVSLKKSQSGDMAARASFKQLEDLKQSSGADREARHVGYSDILTMEMTMPADEMSTKTHAGGEKLPSAESHTSFLGGQHPEAGLVEKERSDITIRSDRDTSSVAMDPVGQTTSLSQVLKTIDKVIYQDGVAMMWKKLDYSDEEVLVPVPPNSLFSEQEHSVASTARAEKPPSAPRPPREPCHAFVKRFLGPAAYRAIFKQEKPVEVKAKIPGADWSLQLKTQRLASRPPLLYYDQWKENQLKKNCLGPGCYEVRDFIQLGNAKPRSARGICDQVAPRFDKTVQSFTPGPGAYGIGGIPHTAIENSAKRSFSTKGMLDAGDRKRDLPCASSSLAPGTYNIKSCTDQLLNKVTGLKGPYQLFSGKRNEPIHTGYLAAPKRSKLGPGYYQFQSFVDELTTSKHNFRGRFYKRRQYPDVPTERFLLFPKYAPSFQTKTPGPAAYEVKDFPTYRTVNQPGFLSSAERANKMAERIFAVTCNPVGPGRYITEKYVEPYVNGHTNVFKSKTGKPNLKLARCYEERLKTKQGSHPVNPCHPGKQDRPILSM